MMLSVMRLQESSAAAALPAAVRRRRSSSFRSRSYSASASATGSPGGVEPPGLSVAQHRAVARQVRGDHRHARGHRLGQHDAEALGRQRRRADDLGRGHLGDLLLVVHPAQRLDAGQVHGQAVAVAVGLEHLATRGAGDDERRLRQAPPQERERLQKHAEPLPALGASHEEDASAHLGRTHRRRVLLHGDAVGDDPVLPRVATLREGPGGLAHGDTHVDAAHDRIRQELEVVVERRLLQGRVERADHRARRHQNGRAGDPRRAGLVYVQHVEAPVAHGAIHAPEDLRRDPHVGARAVGRDGDGGAHRDEALGHGPPAAVHRAARRCHGAHRRDDPGLVAALLELVGEVLDMVVHPARDGPGVRGYEAYAHPEPPLSARPCRAGTGSRAPRASPAAARRGSRAGAPRTAR